jgi:hypothetical protein
MGIEASRILTHQVQCQCKELKNAGWNRHLLKRAQRGEEISCSTPTKNKSAHTKKKGKPGGATRVQAWSSERTGEKITNGARRSAHEASRRSVYATDSLDPNSSSLSPSSDLRNQARQIKPEKMKPRRTEREKHAETEAAGCTSRQQGENLRITKSVCGQEPWDENQNRQEKKIVLRIH